MTPASKKYLHPEAIRRIGRLEIRARHIVEGFLSGMHRSPYFGQSVEFLEHREYSPGDDLRHVDWKVWARQDRLYVKRFEEDTNLQCTMLIDASASMQYGRGPLSKFDYAATAAASLAYLLLRQQDAVGCITFADDVHRAIPCRSKRVHLDSIVRALVMEEPREKTELLKILQYAAETGPRRGMIVLFSDLLTETDGFVRGLKMLRQRGHDVLILHVMDDDELDFPFDGPTRFEGLELPAHLVCNPKALRSGYLEAVNSHLHKIRRESARNGADYTLIRTSAALDASLAAFLSHRMGRMRRGTGASTAST